MGDGVCIAGSGKKAVGWFLACYWLDPFPRGGDTHHHYNSNGGGGGKGLSGDHWEEGCEAALGLVADIAVKGQERLHVLGPTFGYGHPLCHGRNETLGKICSPIK